MTSTTGGNDDAHVEALSSTSLASLTATPQAIGAFGQTVIHWDATAPALVRLQLNGLPVAHTGSRQCQPRVDTAYRLEAHAGTARKSLGAVMVRVDTATCAPVLSSFDDPRAMLLRFVKDQILNADASLYIPMHSVAGPFGSEHLVPFEPEIVFTPGRMRFVIHLSSQTSNAPDPAIEITIEMGLDIDPLDGSLKGFDPVFRGTVDEPWIIDLVPVYGLIVTLSAGEAQAKLPMQFQALVDAIPALVSLVYPIDSTIERYQTVSIAGDPADPPIRLVACAKPPRRRVTGVGTAGVLTEGQGGG